MLTEQKTDVRKEDRKTMPPVVGEGVMKMLQVTVDSAVYPCIPVNVALTHLIHLQRLYSHVELVHNTYVHSS